MSLRRGTALLSRSLGSNFKSSESSLRRHGLGGLICVAAVTASGLSGSNGEYDVTCEPINSRAEAHEQVSSSLGKLDKMIETLRARTFVAPFVDHTLLSATATKQEIFKLCNEAVAYGFQAVCVNGSNVKIAKEALEHYGGGAIKVCAVVGFPLGASSTSVKTFEALQAIEDGAVEIDMVLNVGRVKSQDWDYVMRDLASVIGACKDKGAICKVILETCLLTEEEKKAVCKLCALAGADFVKTSTGFSTGGATIDDVKLMYGNVRTISEIVPIDDANVKEVQVKASGGIKTSKEAIEMLRAGATRIGTSRAAGWCSSGPQDAASTSY